MPEETGNPGAGRNPQPTNIVPPHSGGVPPNIPAAAAGSVGELHRVTSFPVIAVLLFLFVPIGTIVIFAFDRSNVQSWPITEARSG